MSDSFVFFDISTKLVKNIIRSSSLNAYEDGVIYGNDVAIDLDNFSGIPFPTIANTYHWMGEGISVGTHEANSNPVFTWDTVLLTYREPDGYFEMMRTTMHSRVNSIANEKILESYPIYRQLNLGRDPTTSEAITMFNFIDNIRNESNISNDQLLNASTIAEMEDIVSQFQQRI